MSADPLALPTSCSRSLCIGAGGLWKLGVQHIRAGEYVIDPSAGEFVDVIQRHPRPSSSS